MRLMIPSLLVPPMLPLRLYVLLLMLCNVGLFCSHSGHSFANTAVLHSGLTLLPLLFAVSFPGCSRW